MDCWFNGWGISVMTRRYMYDTICAENGNLKEDIRMNKNIDWKGIILVVSSLILMLFSFAPMLVSLLAPLLLGMQLHIDRNSSIGIIGGADGPTSIFIAGKVGTPWGLYIATAVVVIATIMYFVKKRKR